MFALKLLGILAASAGIGFPVVASLRETQFPSASEVTNQAKSVIKVKWLGEGSEQNLGLFLSGLGKVIDSPNPSGGGKKEEVLGLELKSWGMFEKDTCSKLGLTGGNALLAGISCELSAKE
ncbi:hypothetical protein [Mycoplasma suis]|uniref:Uncharacterized protein n=2 Tax=Mycoplasma suis TaxID=57372 RepID=F0QQU3_MYCSL|nr:hypothetical protein [Mycoplasma suis]ADX97863.1 hypothetical protein MSU_0321 [Mycoplasma suis str. Illinois]CBZ40363.1 hypothetical protein MSUIS_02700 [Mycoplasma suis KI3806]